MPGYICTTEAFTSDHEAKFVANFQLIPDQFFKTNPNDWNTRADPAVLEITAQRSRLQFPDSQPKGE
jgi:hypothetical protein